MKTDIVIFFGAALFTILGMPLLTRLARALDLVDKPGLRKVHAAPVPRIGGVVVAFATLGMILPVLALDNVIGAAFHKIAAGVATLLLAAAVVFITGLIDDIRGLRAAWKLVVLIVAALAICCSGSRIETLGVEPWFTIDLGWASWPITVLWIVGITVGINFIDGLDGLAAGISAIVCGTIAVLAYTNGQLAMLALMLAILGSLAGFLFFNFNPAKVFLGDCGSMFLGFMIGAGSVVCVAKGTTLVGMAAAACALGVPILDTTLTMLRRGVLDRRSIFAGERGHIHHRLLDLGFRQQQVVWIIHGVSLLGAMAGLLMIGTHHFEAILIFLGVVVGFFLFFHFVGAARIGETVAAVRQSLAVRQLIKKEQSSFDDAQLRMREATTFDGWWAAVCRLAEELDYVWVTITLPPGDAAARTTQWRRPGEAPAAHNLLTITVPVTRGESPHQARIEAGLLVNGSLEASVRRSGLLARLIDEHGLKNLPGQAVEVETPSSAPAAPSQPDAATENHSGATESAPKALEILGVPVMAFESYDQAVDAVEERIVARRPTFAVAINPEKIYRARQDPRLLAVLQDATFGLCDGIGVAVAGLLLHRHLLQRCTGCDFFFRMTERAALRGWGVFLLGASAEANERAAAKLTERYPGLRIVGRRDGFFSDSAAVVREINESGADLLFVAMGSPKQELWLAEQRASLQAPFCMGVGGSFDVAGGLARRAPKFFQKTGTEYLFQLVTRPGWKTGVKWERTLARLKFMLTVARVACGGRAGRSERRAIPVEVLREPPAGAGIFQESAAEGRAEVRGRDV